MLDASQLQQSTHYKTRQISCNCCCLMQRDHVPPFECSVCQKDGSVQTRIQAHPRTRWRVPCSKHVNHKYIQQLQRKTYMNDSLGAKDFEDQLGARNLWGKHSSGLVRFRVVGCWLRIGVFVTPIVNSDFACTYNGNANSQQQNASAPLLQQTGFPGFIWLAWALGTDCRQRSKNNRF